jgi:hypothetical protein
VRKLAALLALVCLTQNLAFAAAPARVWAVNDGEKVERDDLAHKSRDANSAWDGRRVKLFGARNEVVAFQLIVEAGPAGVGALSVRLPELRRRGGGGRVRYAPPGADPTDYAGRPIQIFSVNYMNVTAPTRADWVWRPDSPAAPADTRGWKPVQLVPENAKRGRGGFPLSVAPNQNQAVWVEVYLGRDLRAGVYEGRVEVTADGARQSVPVELELFDFALPDENSMNAMVYYEPSQPEQYMGRNLDPAFHRFAHRHRVELVHAYNIESATAARGRFDGSHFTRGRGYEGPGEGVGNRLIPASFYNPPGRDYDDRASAREKSDRWMTFLRRNFPRALTFLYMPDEPGPSEYERIRRIAENVHTNPGPGRALPIFVTKRYTEGLDGAIDIWDTGPLGFDIETSRRERAKGRRYWIYNGGRPAAGAIVIDSPATDPRATVWACFKHDVETYFYWHGVHWKHNSQKQGVREQNVWADPITFDNRKQERKGPEDKGFINGDGVLIYPGEERVHPEEDRGVAGPVATVQLANFRRGLQDHQYLTLARRLGLGAEVEAALQAVVPRVFSDVAKDGAAAFAETGDEFERARYRLAQAIARAGKKGTPRRAGK